MQQTKIQRFHRVSSNLKVNEQNKQQVIEHPCVHSVTANNYLITHGIVNLQYGSFN